MRVAIVCPDGLSILLFCRGIIRALQGRAAVSEVVVVSADGYHKKDIEQLGAKSVSLSMYRYVSPVADVKYFLALYTLFQREQFGAVITISTKPNIYGTIAARLAGVKLVIPHVLGLGSVFLESRDVKSHLLRRVVLLLYRLAFRASTKAWFTNKNDAAFFLTHGLIPPGKVTLTKNYLDPMQYSPECIGVAEVEGLRKELNISEGNTVVLMVARMIWPKGVREFVEAAALLRLKCAFTKWLLVGPLEPGNPHSVPETYLKEAERLGNFQWLGFRTDVRTLYALADLAVLPTYYKEGGFPRGLLEPMAMAKPVIATDSEDCKGTVEEGKNGFLVPPRNAAALADAIDKLISDDTLRRRFGAYSREKVLREFDEKLIIAKALDELGIPDSATA